MELTDELIANLAAEIAAGLSQRAACGKLGVLSQTFDHWKKRGASDRAAGLDTKCARLSLGIDFARAEQEADLLTGAKSGTMPERVALFLLERRFPDYQQRQVLEVEGHMEHTDVRARIEARLVRNLDAAEVDGRVLEEDGPPTPLGLPEKVEP